jgi:translation initiation factor 2 alpha subunit (eIF-2alpha)
MAVRIPFITEFNGAGVRQASRAFDKMSADSKKVSTAMKVSFAAVGASIASVSYLAYDFAKAAMADEKAAAELSRSLKATTGATDAQVKAIEDFISVTELATGVADDELRPAYASISRVTKDLTKSQKLLSLAQNISAGTGKPLALTAKAVAQAYGGQFGALKKLSPETAKLIKGGASADEVFKSLDKTFKGAAETAATTTAGKFQRFNVAVERLKEGIGAQLLPVMNTLAGFFLNKLVPAFEKVQDIFEKKGFVDGLKLMFKQGWDWLKNEGIPTFQAKFKELGTAFTEWIRPRIVPFLKELGNLIATGANWLLDVGLPLYVDKMKELYGTFVEWIKPQIAPMLKELGVLIGKVAEWALTVALPKLVALAAEWGKALIGFAIELAPEIIKGLGSAFGEIVKALGRIAKKLLDAFIDLGKKLGKGIANGAIDGLNKIIDGLNDLLEFKISLPFGKSFTVNAPDIPNIPKLAEGGIVNSATLAVIGERGPEAVIPLDKLNGMGGNTFVIQTGVGDPVAIGREIENVMARYSRRTGKAA